jgi:hypothetical protein
MGKEKKTHRRKEREKYRGNRISSLNAFLSYFLFQRDVHPRLEK